VTDPADRPTVDAMAAVTPPPGAVRDAVIDRIIDSAAAMGSEIDRREAEDWIAAMESESLGGKVQVDVDSGVYGHKVTMADYSAAELARFRAMAPIVGIPDEPPVVTTALALSGSAAQSKIQRFPADADFFERVHIRAESREEALSVLGRVIRDKALATPSGRGHRLWEVKWGEHDEAGTVHGKAVRPRSWITWSPADITVGFQELVRPDGSVRRIAWEDAPGRPGWSKLDWLIADPSRGILANASNVLDPTWEGPDGAIVPLDGFLEPYFQEVYLETDSIPLFSRLVKQLGADAVDDYVDSLEHEVWKYSVQEHNYGKVARRLYNVFRLTGRYAEAAYLRELFDEPVTALYQVAALLMTVDDAASAADVFDQELLLGQVDRLIVACIDALEGRDEAEMVARLNRLRTAIVDRSDASAREVEVDAARVAAMAAVNDYFRRALVLVPTIAAYLDELAARGA
jgi:hypothetical protein